MSTEIEFQQRCRQIAAIGDDETLSPTALVGVFQRFRPDGSGLDPLYAGMPRGDAYRQRLDRLYAAAGDDQRPGGGRDAYFVVRKPPSLSPELAEEHADSWLKGLRQLAVRSEHDSLKERLSTMPKIRVLEGIPPKQPKSDQDSFPLLRAIKVDVATLTDGIAEHCAVVSLLREAYYFTACDSMLRDYLLWPAYADHFCEADPLEGYFELWRHGVKWRVFHDDMIDIYLPK